MNDHTQRDQIIEELELANQQLARQNSLRHVFLVGMVYGVGFFVGSAILATVAFGIFRPYFSQIGWLHRTYETGTKP